MGRQDVHGDEAGRLRAHHAGPAADPAARELDPGHRQALQKEQSQSPHPQGLLHSRQSHAAGTTHHDNLHVTCLRSSASH